MRERLDIPSADPHRPIYTRAPSLLDHWRALKKARHRLIHNAKALSIHEPKRPVCNLPRDAKTSDYKAHAAAFSRWAFRKDMIISRIMRDANLLRGMP